MCTTDLMASSAIARLCSRSTPNAVCSIGVERPGGLGVGLLLRPPLVLGELARPGTGDVDLVEQVQLHAAVAPLSGCSKLQTTDRLFEHSLRGRCAAVKPGRAGRTRPGQTGL